MFARIDLVNGRLVFSIWLVSERGKNSPICDSSGELASGITTFHQASALQFNFTCGGDHRRKPNGNWALRTFNGDIHQIEMESEKGEGFGGQGTLVFLPPDDYAHFRKDREDNRKELFGTNEWLAKEKASTTAEGSPQMVPEPVIGVENEAVRTEISELKKKLLELKELVDEGLISQDDYEKAKNQLLEKISH